MAVLMAHEWPGNVRELENTIQRAVVMTRGSVITPDHIEFQNDLSRYILDIEQKVRSRIPLDDMLRDVKREAILASLRLNDHDITSSAAQLGIDDDQMRAYLMELKLGGDLEQTPSHGVLPWLARD